jgi:hypothetical protein
LAAYRTVVWAAAAVHQGKVVPWLIFFIQLVKRAEGLDFSKSGPARPITARKRQLLKGLQI